MKRFDLKYLFLCGILLACAAVSAVSCASAAPSSAELRDVQRSVDYSERSSWILFPEDSAQSRRVDVFYALPTIVAHKDHPYMDWSNPDVQAKAGRFAAQQCGIFVDVGRIYAPYYRQGEYYRIIADAGKPPQEQPFLKLGIRDLRAAFQYYLKHADKDRPFILFGHSQGAMSLLELMKEELKDPAVRRRLVAAYLIGYPKMPVRFPEYPYLRLAQGEDDVGVIINYNSEAPSAVKSVFTGKGPFYCINPLNWRTDGEPAPASAHLGAVFFDYKTGMKVSEVKNFCSAETDPETGALIVIPCVEGKYDSSLMGKGVYHMNDLYFFYRNLQANAKKRIAAFLKKEK